MAKLIIAEGNIYDVDSAYLDPAGKFELFRVKDDAGKNEIACFLVDKCRPLNLSKGDKVKILHISRISLGWKQKKKWSSRENGYVDKWEQEFTAEVEAAKAASDLEDAPDWIDELEGVTPPWEDGDLPL